MTTKTGHFDEEVMLMDALTDANEDARPDDGAIEIDNDEELQGVDV